MAKKVEDDLVEYKKLKHFLDVLAIQAGKKKYNPKQNIYSSSANLNQDGVNTGKNTASTHGDRKGQKKETQGGATFMTQVATSPGKANLLDGLKKKINKDLETTGK